MSARSECQAIAAVFALVVITSVPMAATRASETTSLRIAGLSPGMRLDEFRRLHDTATITPPTAVRYCYGQPIAVEEPSRLEAIVALGPTTLEVGFERHGAEYRLSTIRLSEEISPRLERIREIRDALIQEFGPASQILRRRKMEPTGLIVGFRWTVPSVASLTARIHRDHAEDPDRFYLTRTLAKPAPSTRISPSRGRVPACRR